MPVPGFLFDDPVVRKELSHYYSSVRRADDCVAAILKSLDDSGQRDNTIILFLSDHGMPLPFAKTQVYHHSSVTPLFWIVPGVTKAGTVDTEHMVSAVDLLPTLLRTDRHRSSGPNGWAFFRAAAARRDAIRPRLRDQGIQRERRRLARPDAFVADAAVSVHLQPVVERHAHHGHRHDRHIDLPPHGRTGENRFLSSTPGTNFIQHRVPEELYDIEKDPDCLNNLIDSPQHRRELNTLRGKLEQWMVQTNDGMLAVFRNRDDAAVREAYVAAQEKEAEARKSRGKSDAKKAAATKGVDTKAAPRKRTGLIAFALPESIAPGTPVTIRIEHKLPGELGEQVLTVTLKGGPNGKRLDRQTVEASGEGIAEVTFDVPADVPGGVVSFAAFVGADFQTSLQHIQSPPQPVQ